MHSMQIKLRKRGREEGGETSREMRVWREGKGEVGREIGRKGEGGGWKMNNNIISINDLFKDTPTGEESREGGGGGVLVYERVWKREIWRVGRKKREREGGERGESWQTLSYQSFTLCVGRYKLKTISNIEELRIGCKSYIDKFSFHDFLWNMFFFNTTISRWLL